MSLLVLPVLVPLLGGALGLLFPRQRTYQRVLGVLTTATLLAVGVALLAKVRAEGILVHRMGGWEPPFGIVFVADTLGALMVVLAGLIGFATSVYSLGSIDPARERWGYHPLLNILLMGVCGAFLTGDLFNLYVWFEVLLIASFVLLALGGERGQMEASIKYVTINLVASALFLTGLGILYGLVGTLNMADLAQKLQGTGQDTLVTAVAMLFLAAFGIKAAVFPLFFWLPASYHTPPPAVSAVFAGLLTKVGVYALVRVFTLVFTQEPGLTHDLLLAIAGLTMVTGVLGAVAQDDARRVLSFHIVSQIGYMVFGLAIGTPLAIAGCVFYIAHHIVVKSNLFLVSGAVFRLHGTERLKRLGGLVTSAPFLSLLFLVPALSLAGIPPLSGFWAKLALVRAGLDAKEHLAVAVALAVGLLTLFSMTKIWGEAFWRPPGPDAAPRRSWTRREAVLHLAPIAMLAAVTLAISLAPGALFSIAQEASDELSDPSAYVAAVFGSGDGSAPAGEAAPLGPETNVEGGAAAAPGGGA